MSSNLVSLGTLMSLNFSFSTLPPCNMVLFPSLFAASECPPPDVWLPLDCLLCRQSHGRLCQRLPAPRVIPEGVPHASGPDALVLQDAVELRLLHEPCRHQQ